MTGVSLPAIAALVRTGAVGRGWALFEAGGYLAQTEDPAALAVKGRLLKARARRAQGRTRMDLMAQAASAYAAAHALSPAPYLAINAATLSLLAGELIAAQEQARTVLAMLDARPAPADTPYFLAATRAEALLLLQDRPAAEAAMGHAAQCDPDGWDDRAATLAQLREVLAATDQDPTWLDRFAPPASLHFAGHMGFACGGAAEADLTRQLGAILSHGQFGFAWGALAAGADIIIAEHLLSAGADLHIVLPCPIEQFAAQSVAPAGTGWTARFRALLPQIASLQIAAACCGSAHDPLATAHAGELAIGGALNNSQRLGTSATQLVVVDEHGGGTNTARQAALWPGDRGKQKRLTLSRDAAVETMFPIEQNDQARGLAVHLAIGLDEIAGSASLSSDRVEVLTRPITKVLETLPAGSVRAAPGRWECTLTDPNQALDALAGLLAIPGSSPAIGVHLAISTLVRDPASGALLPYGGAPAVARQVMELAPPGLALASDPFGVTMAVRGGGPLRSELYLPDAPDLGGPIHTLLPRDQ